MGAPAAGMTDEGLVYVVEREPHVKVGKSTRRALRSRLSSLQTGCPDELRLVSVVPCGKVDAGAVETKAHTLFRVVRVRGEWFLMPGQLALTYVTEIQQMLLRGASDEDWLRFHRRIENTFLATSVRPDFDARRKIFVSV